MTTTDDRKDLDDALAPPSLPFDLDADPIDDGDYGDALAEWQGPGDLDEASWAARKLTRAKAEMARLTQLAADQHTRIDDWLARRATVFANDVAFFNGVLHGFHERALATDPKHAKTIDLPDGTILRSQAGKLAVEVTDVPALVAWAERQGLTEEILAYPDPTPKKAELTKRFGDKAAGETEPGTYPAIDEPTGEVIPGVSITRKPRSFTVNSPNEEPTT